MEKETVNGSLAGMVMVTREVLARVGIPTPRAGVRVMSIVTLPTSSAIISSITVTENVLIISATAKETAPDGSPVMSAGIWTMGSGARVNVAVNSPSPPVLVIVKVAVEPSAIVADGEGENDTVMGSLARIGKNNDWLEVPVAKHE